MSAIKYIARNLLIALMLLIAQPIVAADNENISAKLSEELQQKILLSFSNKAKFGEFDETAKALSIVVESEIVGYVFETDSQVSIPAYSGKPINVAVAINNKGEFRYLWVLEHHEPILLVGIPVKKLHDFTMNFVNHKITDKIRVGSSGKDDQIMIDAVTGATVTVLVVNETIMRASHKVAISLGLIKPSAEEILPISTVKSDVFETRSWDELTGDGTIRRLHLTRADVDEGFVGTTGSEIDVAEPEEKQDTFIDLYYTYLNAPTAGKNLLGESEYQWLMDELKPGEHAVAFMANGLYSFRGNGFVRGGIFDRVSLIQKDVDITFRDLDYYRLNDIYPEGNPKFSEMAIYIVRDHYNFDPGLSWELNLLVRRQIGPIESTFVNFNGSYKTPESYIERPIVVAPKEPRAMWVTIWEQKAFQIIVFVGSLILLTVVIFLQNWLINYPVFLHTVRRMFLLYTVFFIGWYCLGQLSVVNVFTFVPAVFGSFSWELFLMDPIIFILWVFTAATVLLWGRGIFCGWLCPFGALQELINELARKLKIKQYDVPFHVHEKLWTIKYVILLVLFGVSIESMSNAERLAEVEPFKTTFLLFFQREWWFVSYAALLLIVSIFTRKVYCRYICPLGAGLGILTQFRLFDWLKRRPECGSPCQVCAKECEIQAIYPDGRINGNECHHCLDCQVTYNNQNRCPALVLANKKGRRKLANKIGSGMSEDEHSEIINLAKKAEIRT